MADRSRAVSVRSGSDCPTISCTDGLVGAGVVPVVTFPDPGLAEPVFEALRAGGLPVLEVALRAEGANDVIRRLAAAYPEALVGAGTVLTVDDAYRVIDFGAKFVVSPVTDARVIEACTARGIPVLPGACTPTEVRKAQDAGAELIKFFPAEPSGGQAFLRALAGPLPTARLVPTGGIDAENLAGYLSLPNVAACGGSWMVPGVAMTERRYGAVTTLAAQAVAIVKKVRSRG